MPVRCLGTFVCLLTFVPGAPFAQGASARDKTSEQQLAKMTEEVLASEVRVDLPAMDRYFTDNYTHTHAVGLVESKATFIGTFKSGMRRYKAAAISQLQVRHFGPSALVSGHEEIDGANGVHQYVFTAFWVQEQGKWRLAAWVTSPFYVPGAPASAH
jgi:hypothetical protein